MVTTTVNLVILVLLTVIWWLKMIFAPHVNEPISSAIIREAVYIAKWRTLVTGDWCSNI